MPTPTEIEEKFWKALKSDRTMMLGLVGVDDGLGQPMTATTGDRDGRGPIWVFTAKDTDFCQAMGDRHAAIINFASKGHDVFAAVDGEIVVDNDRATVDRLWNPFVAAWYPGGKDDPNLQLVRFEPTSAQIWLNENSLFAGMKMLLGSDPKKDYADKMTEVRLG